MAPRKTEQRAAIYEVIEQSEHPLSVQEILEAAQQTCPGLGIATVYRNVKRLLEEETICRVELLGETCRYELASLEHHHHFHCRICKKVFDFHGCLEGIESLAPSGFVADAHEIILYGRCARCVESSV